MDDNHSNSRLKVFEHLDESGRFRAFLPIVARRMKVVDDRQARIPYVLDAFLDLLHRSRVLDPGETAVATDGQHRDVLLDANLHVAIEELGPGYQSAHVRVDVGGMQ